LTPLVPLVMFGWIPFAVWLFKVLKARHAVIAGFLLSWMFLPQYTFGIAGIPDYSKVSAMSYGILLGTLIFNSRVLTGFRPRLLDLPILMWCVVPFFTSLSNSLGAYDGVSATLGRMTMWGLPYFIGRLYFYDRKSLAELAFGIFLGGLIYIPFCLWEVVMSPRLHRIIYGFHPHDFGQTKRGGGWRPVVFMQHGLMTAMWMVTAFLSGYQLLRSGWLYEKFPLWKWFWGPAIITLFITIILCKSTGALGLLLLGIVTLHVVHMTRWSLPVLLLLILPVLYVLSRGTGVWDGRNLIEAAGRIASPERTGSLAFRLENENILVIKAKERILLGWGGWGRSFVRDQEGKPISVPDGLWILTFGQNGVIGLSALLTVMLLPPLLFLRLYPPANWRAPPAAALASFPLIMGLFTIDSLFNAMFNPLILILSGGLTGLWLTGLELESEEPEIIFEPAAVPRTRLF
jgi:hypothetical protein